MAAVNGPQQRALKLPIPLGGGQFEIAARLVIQHQGITGKHQLRPLQRHGAAGLAGIEIGDQPAGGASGQGVIGQTKALQVANPKALLQSAICTGGFKGSAGLVREAEPIGAPFRRFDTRQQQFGCLQLQQFLLQLRGSLALVQQQFACGDISDSKPPALLVIEHNSGQPVVAPGRQHPLFQNGSRGEDTGDIPLQQRPFGCGGFQLIAEGHGMAAAHQFTAVALGGVVGDPCHRDPANGFAPLFAGEGEL